MPDLRGKTALVTGGTGHIGRAIVYELERCGAEVAFTFNTNAKAAHELCWEAVSTFAVQMGVTDRERVRFVLAGLSLDILVNCAGINRPADFDAITDDDWDAVLDVNLKGPFIVTQEALPYMRNRGGSIVNIGSVCGFNGGPRTTHYAVSKAGLVALTQNVALFGAKWGIRCNLVAPGYIESPMADAAQSPAAVKVAKMMEAVPLGRLGMPENVAKAVAFLASDDAAYITGHVLHVNGGLWW
jgi:NAD(P)-dependent dehydrogenase (short-subunit alcohol dehydrogenase family)